MQTFSIARGRKIAAECKNHSLEWPKIVEVLTTHKVGSDKKDNGYFVGGIFANNRRNAENMVSRSMVTIDVDSFDGTGEDVISELEHNLPYTLLAYSTYSSRVDKPKFRIVIPLLSEIPARDYEPLCKALADEFKEFIFDPCAFKPELAMYMPSSSQESIMDSFSYSKTVEFLDVNDFNIEKYRDSIANNDSDDNLGITNDLEDHLKYQPLDISDDDIQEHLLVYKAENIIPYEDWVDVGRALYHQYEGSEQGYQLWYNWSALDPARFEAKEMSNKWLSFTKRVVAGKPPLTFATVVMRANEVREIELSGLFEDVTAPIEGELVKDNKNKVTDEPSLMVLGERLSKLSLSVVSEIKRQMMAKTIYDEIGKVVGMKQAAILKVLMPKNKKVVIEGKGPKWAEDWVFIETRNKYHNVITNYEIGKEAFNIKFSGEIECKDAEMLASQLMSVVYRMKTVVDIMYWPKADQFCKDEGKNMLNSYKNYGVVPAVSLDNDPEGQRVVDDFIKHVDMSFNNEREKTIMLDWMCHIYKKPEQRVNWGLLLQGSQGTGKSYFSEVMQRLLGRNAQQVTPQSIMGNFSGWATGSTLNIVEEIYVAGNHKYELMNKIKGYIRNDSIQIEEKNQNARNVPNFCSYLFFSNHPDALAITDDERGFCIIYGAIQSKEQLNKLLGGADGATAYFNNLFDNGIKLRPDAIAHYLMNREISKDFDHKSRAPATLGRDSMVNLSKNPEVEQMEDLIEKFRCAVINEKVIDLTYLASCIKIDFDADGLRLPSQKMTNHILHELNYRKIINRINVYKKDGTRTMHTIWHNINESCESSVDSIKEFHNQYIF